MKEKKKSVALLLGENLIWSSKKEERLANDDEILCVTVEFFSKLKDLIEHKCRNFLMIVCSEEDYALLYQVNRIREMRKRIRFEIFCYNRELFDSLQQQYPLYPPIHPKDKITYLTEYEKGNEAEFQTDILNHATVVFCVYNQKKVSPTLKSIIGQATALKKQVIFQSSNPWKEYMDEIKDKVTPFPNF